MIYSHGFGSGSKAILPRNLTSVVMFSVSRPLSLLEVIFASVLFFASYLLSTSSCLVMRVVVKLESPRSRNA